MAEYVVCRNPGDTDGDGGRVESVRHRVFRNEQRSGRNVKSFVGSTEHEEHGRGSLRSGVTLQDVFSLTHHTPRPG